MRGDRRRQGYQAAPPLFWRFGNVEKGACVAASAVTSHARVNIGSHYLGPKMVRRMPEFTADCPRCNAQRVTFDLQATNRLGTKHGWQGHWEAYSICRACHRGTVFFVAAKGVDESAYLDKKGFGEVRSVGDFVSVTGHLSSANFAAQEPPESLPDGIRAAFEEAAKCVAVGCYNAAGTMFRLCLDLATRARLPEQDVEGLNPRIRGSLGLTLGWLFNTNRLPAEFRELADCVSCNSDDLWKKVALGGVRRSGGQPTVRS